MADEETTVGMEGGTFDRAVRMACQTIAEGGDDVKIEFELAGIKWRLRVEAVGIVLDDDDGEDE